MSRSCSQNPINELPWHGYDIIPDLFTPHPWSFFCSVCPKPHTMIISFLVTGSMLVWFVLKVSVFNPLSMSTCSVWLKWESEVIVKMKSKIQRKRSAFCRLFLFMHACFQVVILKSDIAEEAAENKKQRTTEPTRMNPPNFTAQANCNNSHATCVDVFGGSTCNYSIYQAPLYHQKSLLKAKFHPS